VILPPETGRRVGNSSYGDIGRPQVHPGERERRK